MDISPGLSLNANGNMEAELLRFRVPVMMRGAGKVQAVFPVSYFCCRDGSAPENKIAHRATRVLAGAARRG
jgi:hypothetical protein